MFQEILIKWASPLLQYNIVDNCIDRHVEASPDRVALIWEKDEPNQHEHVTYRYVVQGMITMNDVQPEVWRCGRKHASKT